MPFVNEEANHTLQCERQDPQQTHRHPEADPVRRGLSDVAFQETAEDVLLVLSEAIVDEGRLPAAALARDEIRAALTVGQEQVEQPPPLGLAAHEEFVGGRFRGFRAFVSAEGSAPFTPLCRRAFPVAAVPILALVDVNIAGARRWVAPPLVAVAVLQHARAPPATSYLPSRKLVTIGDLRSPCPLVSERLERTFRCGGIRAPDCGFSRGYLAPRS